MKLSTALFRREAEVPLPERRQHAPLETNERADKRVERDQQRELPRVRPEAETDLRHVDASVRLPRFAATIAA